MTTWSEKPTTKTRSSVPQLPQRKIASASVPPIAESDWSTTYWPNARRRETPPGGIPSLRFAKLFGSSESV